MAKKRRPKEKKRLIIIASSPHISTGFAHVGRTFADLAVRSNIFDDIDYIAYNHPASIPEDKPILDSSITVHSEQASQKKFGEELLCNILPDMLKHNTKICIITIGDPWNFYYMEYIAGINKVRWIPYVPVESNLPSSPVAAGNTSFTQVSLPSLYNKSDINIAYSKYGRDVLRDMGIPCDDYMYHLIDPSKIDEYSKDNTSTNVTNVIRKVVGKSHVIGMVGANAYRKGIDLVLAAYKILLEEYHDDVTLIMHTPRARGSKKTIFMDYIAAEYNVPVILMEDLISKKTKEAGPVTVLGYDEATLDGINRSFNTFISMSRAEGFGIPVVEAACRGIFTIVPDCATLGELGTKIGITKIKVEDYYTSNVDTNQLLYHPNARDAARIIHERIHDPQRMQYNISEFDVRNDVVMDKFKEIMNKALFMSKDHTSVLLNFSGTVLESTKKSQYVINAYTSGIKRPTEFDKVCDLYSGYHLDIHAGSLPQDSALAKTYSSMFESVSDRLINDVHEIFVTSWTFPVTKYDGENIRVYKPDSVYPNLVVHNTDSSDIDPESVLIVVAGWGKAVSLFDVLGKEMVGANLKKYYTVVQSTMNRSLHINVPERHLKTEGYQYISPYKAVESHFKYVVVPYSLFIDYGGSYIVDNFGPGKCDRLIVDCYVPRVTTTDAVLTLAQNNHMVEMYGMWESLPQIIKCDAGQMPDTTLESK